MNNKQIAQMASIGVGKFTIITEDEREVELDIPDMRGVENSLIFKTKRKFISDYVEETGIKIVNFKERK